MAVVQDWIANRTKKVQKRTAIEFIRAYGLRNLLYEYANSRFTRSAPPGIQWHQCTLQPILDFEAVQEYVTLWD